MASQGPSLTHRIQAALLKGAVGACRLMGVDRASAASGALWRTFGPKTRRQARIATQLRLIFPGISEAEVNRISAGVWDNLGRVFAESLLLDEIADDPSRIEIVDRGGLLDLVASGQAASLASLHMGNWELCGVASTKVGLKVAGVYKRLSNPVVEAWLLDTRRRYYAGGLFNAGEKARAVRGLLGALRSGQSIAMIADLFDGAAPTIPFAGEPARCVDFPALAARSQGVPLFAVRVLRTDGVRFRVEVVRIPVAETADKTADIASAHRHLHDQFAQWILETPEQWFWIHPKWEATRQALRQA